MYKNSFYHKFFSILFMLFGVFLLSIFVTFNNTDISWNSTQMWTNGGLLVVARNHIADLFFQILGKSSYIIPFILLNYSLQFFFNKSISFLKLKLFLLLFFLVLFSTFSCNGLEDYGCGILGMLILEKYPILVHFQIYAWLILIMGLIFILSWSLRDVFLVLRVIIFSLALIKKKLLFAINTKSLKLENNSKLTIQSIPNVSFFTNMVSKINESINSKKINHHAYGQNGDDHIQENNFSQDSEIKNDNYQKKFQTKLNDSDRENFLQNSVYFNQMKHNYTSPKVPNEDIDNHTSYDDAPDELNMSEGTNIVNNKSNDYSGGNIDSLVNNLSKEKDLINKANKKSTSYRDYSISLNFLNIVKSDNTIKASEIKENALKIEKIIEEFGISGSKIVGIKSGPVVTLYELVIPAGVKTSKLIALETDIALRMKAVSVRIAIVPGSDVIGIELPNKNRKTVYLKEIIQSKDFATSSAKLPIALGCDINGKPVVADLTTMPHLLIAGTTGSGKSVGVNGMILSLLYKLNPNQCKLIMIDPKMLELSVYQDIPHLITPVVTNPKQAISSLKWVVKEMEYRYYQMSLLGVRNIIGFNDKIKDINFVEKIRHQTLINQGVEVKFDYMPYIVVIIDEMADLMIVAGKEVESAVQRLAQMARASGIHLIMATQRPSVDVITGTIKANFPTRVSFQVSSKIDSRTILGEQGAEQLLGKGDLLYMSGVGRIQRVHGPFISDDEVFNIVEYLKSIGSPSYIENLNTNSITIDGLEEDVNSDQDELFEEALNLIRSENKASTSFLQRKFQIGYNRAARIMEQLENAGIVSKASATGKRDILLK